MKKIFSICFLFILVGLSHAQKKERPKVGLVLSGGGAKGLAHIGVLKVIEQAGVEIDYIAGTSMGAIIGGLYASGYTAAVLDSIFQRVDADALIQDYVPRAAKSFYEKKNDEIYALTLPFDNFKLGIPKALSKGMYNYNLLSRLLGHVRYLRDFNDLEIPFLCVATDAETGEAVILNQGSLPQAILASGAFPSLYTPVEIDGRMLIDGGVVNNYPLNELKQMGADVIIGVDVQDGLKDREAIEGATDLLLQISNYSTIKQMNEKRALTDVYIKPDIAGFTVVSFGEGKEIIERGRLAGLQVLDQLKALGTEVKAQPKHYLPKFNDTLKISDIKLNPLSTYTSSYVQGKLGFRSNTPITYQMLGNGIDNLNGSQNFSAISYKFERDGEYDVFDIHLDENKVKRLLRLGLHYDGLYKSAALVNLTQKKFLFKNDVASLDIALGDNFRYNFNYYIDNGFYWSVGLSSKYNNFSRTVPFPAVEGAGSQPNNLSVNYKEIANRLYFQTIFVQKFLIGVGLEHKYFDVKSPTLNPDDGTMDRGNYFSGHAYLRFDSYDNKYFPTKGFVFKGEYTNYFYSTDFNHNFENFSQVTGEIGLVKTLFNRFSAEVHSEIGFTVGSESSPFFNFFLGGYGFAESYNIIPFYGYDFLGVFENSYVKTRVELDYEFIRKNHINLAVNFANVGRSLFSTTEWISPPSYTGYALGYGMETLLGPIEIKHSWSPETNNHFTWFSVGFWF